MLQGRNTFFVDSDEDWAGVTLEDFASCDFNMANNRQTRMLANLSLVHCYNTSAMSPQTRNRTLLQSAKKNLEDLTYFGITEFQRESQLLFEATFNVKFKTDFVQFESGYAADYDVTPAQQKLVLSRNELDVQLYEFAKQLFLTRYRQIASRSEHKTGVQKRLGQISWLEH